MITLSGLQAKAIGRVRLLCPRLAAKTILAPKLGQFARDYPDVELEITTDDSRVDLVSAGFDAGIQFGEYIAQDMVAVRVSPDLRPAIVGAPSYFASHPKPTSPRDVLQHQCIGFRHRGESKYRWEFDKGGQSMAISVSGSLLVDDLDLIIQAALDGAGLAWVAEDRVAPQLASGTLVRVLEDWCPPFPASSSTIRVGNSNQRRSRLSSKPSVCRTGAVARGTSWSRDEVGESLVAQFCLTPSRNPGEHVRTGRFTRLLG